MATCRVEEAVWHILNSTAAISAVVADRISHEVGRIDDAFPQIVIRVQRNEPIANLATTSPAAIATVEVVEVAENFDDAHNLARLVRLAVDRYHGTVTLSNGDTCFIHCAACDYYRQAQQVGPEGNDLGIFGAYQTFTITHELGV